MHKDFMSAMPEIPTASPTFFQSVSRLPSFRKMVATRHRIDGVIFFLVMFLYVGFFALFAYAENFVGTGVAGFGSMGFLLLLVMIVSAWVIAWFYLGYLNRHLAPLEQRALDDVRAQIAQSAGARR